MAKKTDHPKRITWYEYRSDFDSDDRMSLLKASDGGGDALALLSLLFAKGVSRIDREGDGYAVACLTGTYDVDSLSTLLSLPRAKVSRSLDTLARFGVNELLEEYIRYPKEGWR